MPPACPVDLTSYCSEERNDTRASRGIRRRLAAVRCSEERNDPPGKPVAFDVDWLLSGVARSVTIHRASRWHST